MAVVAMTYVFAMAGIHITLSAAVPTQPMTASFILIKGGCKRPAPIAPIQEDRRESAFATRPPHTRFSAISRSDSRL